MRGCGNSSLFLTISGSQMSGRHASVTFKTEDNCKTGALSIKRGVVLVERKIEGIKFTRLH